MSKIKNYFHTYKRVLYTGALLNLAICGFNALMGQQQAIFLTDIVKLSPILTGIIEAFERGVTFFIAPLLGAIMDNTRLKGGKYSSWVKIYGLGYIVGYVLMFGMPLIFPAGGNGIAIAVAICLIFASTCKNMSSMVNRSLMPAIAETQEERSIYARNINLAKEIGERLFAFVTPLAIVAMSDSVGESNAYFLLTLCMGIIALVVHLVVAGEVKKGVPSDQDPSKDPLDSKKSSSRPSLKAIFGVIFGNKALVLMFFATMFAMLKTFIGSPLQTYYYKYVAENMALVSLQTAIYTPLSILTVIAAPMWVKLWKDTKRASTVAVFIAGLSMILCGVLGRFGYVWYMIVNMIGSCAMVLWNTSVVINYSNCGDYGRWRYGIHANALIMSVFSISTSIARTLCSLVRGFALEAIGFVGGMEPTAALKAGFCNIYIVFGFATFIAIIFLVLMPTSDKNMAAIREDLEAGRTYADSQLKA